MRLFSPSSGGSPVIGQLIVFIALALLGNCIQPAMAGEEAILALSIANNAGESTGKTVQAKIVIDAPPQVVWQILLNYPEIKHTLPGYEKSTVLKSNGNVKIVDLGMRVAPFLPAYNYQVQMLEDQPSYSLTAKRISGDFKLMNANYKLVPQNNGARTLLVYSLKVDTGINLPGSQAIIKANTERTLKALERHAEQEAHKSLIGQR